ncbi:MAG: restriction endonuclease subunit S, partial [Desulfobacterales bacterium]
LREMILQLAVQGKLVPQDPKDEPASVLFEKIKAENERLVKEGKIKKPKPLSPIKSDEIPYTLPFSWEWVRLGNVVDYGEGGKVNSNDIPEDAWLLDLADIEKDTSRIVQRVKFQDRISKSTKAEFQKGDVLYGKLRPYLNKVVVADDNGFCTTEIIPIRGYFGVFPKYLMYSLRSPRFLVYVNSKTYGTKMPRLGTEDAIKSLFPLPPTNEQKRIVAKVDELMALCDQLESRKQQVSENCIQLNDKSIHKFLTSRDPKKFNIHWQRICDNFDLLYSKPENVNKLRQAILQLAVQGKMVPQDLKDEPASVLLEKIKAEKERLIKEWKINKPKPLSPIKSDEILFELPDGWEWVRLGEMGFTQTGTTPSKSNPAYFGKYIPFIKPADILKNNVNYNNEGLSQQGLNKGRLIESDSVLMVCIGGSIGKVNFIEKPCSCNQQINTITPYTGILHTLLNYFMRSPYFQNEVINRAPKTTLPIISKGKWELIPTPLPPAKEQKRIVAKVDKLSLSPLDPTDGHKGRFADKVCIALSLLGRRYGRKLKYAPWNLISFIGKTEFKYGVRSIAYIIDQLSDLDEDGRLNNPPIFLSFLSDQQKLKETGFWYHIDGAKINSIKGMWNSVKKINISVDFKPYLDEEG